MNKLSDIHCNTQAARGDTVCMCASMGMMGMGQFSYDMGYTKMCGTCDMQLKPTGMMAMMMDCMSFMVTFMGM